MRPLSAVLLALAASAAAAAEKPNVLLVCVDDLKPVLGCYGDTVVKSPNIDKLAARGVRFDRAYCNQAVCSPSRNALLVGVRSQNLGIYDLATNFRKAAPDAVTLPQHFKANGYRTESLGKIYHTGHGNTDDAASWSVPSWRPAGSNYADPATKAAIKKRTDAAKAQKKTADEIKKAGYGPPTESTDVKDAEYPDGLLAEEAVARLKAAKPGEPFFLAVGFVKPHLPFCAPKKYWDLYDASAFKPAERQTPPDGAPAYAPQFGGELRQYTDTPAKGPIPADQQRHLIHGYYAAVSFMDAQVGKVLDALDATGLAKNTIVVLWGDHGWHLGDHGQWCKHTNYEQAARIPLIVAVPGGKNGACGSLVESVDVYPTLADLAGLPVPNRVDGASFAAAVKDPSAATKAAVFHSYPRGQRIGRAVRTERYRLVEWKKPGDPVTAAELELYDYVSDPAETKNLAADQPDVVAKLRAILAKQPEAKPQIAAGK